uniref:Uncharacterized protein n=1 Tax=Siphoviridae sp. ctrvp54 TaxID=2825690 RepID=A0A8S5P8Z7_9CAUD|nr:MAG TPA: hypothetical protein [Siphoviridae sp. ctrvp54]
MRIASANSRLIPDKFKRQCANVRQTHKKPPKTLSDGSNDKTLV